MHRVPDGLLALPMDHPVHKVTDGVVYRDRIPDVRRVAAALDHEQLSARQLGDPPRPFRRDDLVLITADHEHRASQRPAEADRLLLISDLLRGVGITQHGLRVGLHAPLDEIVVGLRGVRLGGDLGHEELDVSSPVPSPVVPVLLRPPIGGVEHVVEGMSALFPGVGWRDRQRRRDGHDPGHPLRMSRREQQRPGEAAAGRREHRPLGAGRVEHGRSVTRDDGVGIGRRVPGPVGPAVAARVEGDHTVVPGQERHLHLPVPGVQDRPRGQQQDRRLARAVHLVMDPHA